ncbi:hypothetical protein EJ02DRAFT_451818 [Clathrospora elynae]|uniref:Uncharacterized protein n=1 Tax=Clathrospora elynae TaxID=706981 RepID=A0A6A5SZ83_9PLEO|nr:hypothetical protein EJ02DRAFT_451818 [Clathrospora elynae]
MLAHFGACNNCYIQSRLHQCSFYLARRDEVNRLVHESSEGAVAAPGTFRSSLNYRPSTGSRARGTRILRFDKGRSKFIDALNANHGDWVAPPLPMSSPSFQCPSGSRTNPNVLTPQRPTRLQPQGGAAQLSPPAAASSGPSPPEGPSNDEMDHVYQSFESGLFHDPEDIDETLMAGGAGGLPLQTGCTDYHGTVSPRPSGSTLGGQADPLAQTIGSPSSRDANASSFDPMSIWAGATPVNLSAVRRCFAVPHRGARSPAPSRDDSRESLYMSIDSPSAGKGKGRGRK